MSKIELELRITFNNFWEWEIIIKDPPYIPRQNEIFDLEWAEFLTKKQVKELYERDLDLRVDNISSYWHKNSCSVSFTLADSHDIEGCE